METRSLPPTPPTQSVSSVAVVLLAGALAVHSGCRSVHESQALWKSDGTVAGTAIVARLPERVAHAWTPPVTVGDRLFFLLNDGGNGGVELWTSDGTEAGTALVRDLRPSRVVGGIVGGPKALGVGQRLFFVHEDRAHGAELWTSDGTAQGTVLVRDIVPGPHGSSPNRFASVGGRGLFFVGLEMTGEEAKTYIEPGLWASDGTSDGTRLLKGGTVHPYGSGVASDRLYFLADGALWQTDGTPEGTRRLEALALAAEPYCAAIGAGFVAGEGALYAIESAPDGKLPRRVAAVPELCTDRFVTAADGRTYFTSRRGDLTWELWTTDGTATGTRMLRGFAQGIGGLEAAGSKVYFAASDPEAGTELWRSDGTPEGTLRVIDLEAGTGDGVEQHRTALGDKLLFTSRKGLWITDGTAAGTVRVEPQFHNGDFARVDQNVYWLSTEFDFR